MQNEPPGEPPGFTVTVTGGTVTVILSGELDITNADFITSRLAHVRRERPRRLIFDTARVTFIDCASARLIAATGGWLPPGVKPILACPAPVVRRVFQASGLGAYCQLEFCCPR